VVTGSAARRRRRWRWSLPAVVTVVALVGLLAAPSGAARGVDQIGRYNYVDSNQTSQAPTFNMLVVTTQSTTGNGDDVSQVVPLPFTFQFYDQPATEVRINSNGGLTFDAGDTLGFSNFPLGNDSANRRLVAPWWTDWNPGAGGDVLYGTVGSAPNRIFVVHWKDVLPFAGTAGQTASFQVQLFERTNNIEFHYADTTTSGTTSNGGVGTVGIDNGTSSFLQYSHNQAVLSAGLAIRFSPVRCAGQRATILGTYGADTIGGTSGPDVIVALDGADAVNAGGGNDIVCAGGADDAVVLGSGSDRALGGPGADDLRGGDGGDQLYGGVGNDALSGGRGNDLCNGGPGTDTATTCETRRNIP
jgi:Ca2+-binding RTX toxin-like protein